MFTNRITSLGRVDSRSSHSATPLNVEMKGVIMKNTARPRHAMCISILSRLRTCKGDSHLYLPHFQLFNVKTC